MCSSDLGCHVPGGIISNLFICFKFICSRWTSRAVSSPVESTPARRSWALPLAQPLGRSRRRSRPACMPPILPQPPRAATIPFPPRQPPLPPVDFRYTLLLPIPVSLPPPPKNHHSVPCNPLPTPALLNKHLASSSPPRHPAAAAATRLSYPDLAPLRPPLQAWPTWP